ncbi:hypothetical protein [Chryseolinea lacunae]|uniref:S9 family peptidase n=1 Tax=Chryseolinea lacunae TaxID=2801331 RepID=A0ABS1KR34_9BACT|nr:hypothetical protein [Chryseolinea lacunae]MBL0741658.1 hypothetical protein [Chryseolinea lacunae]
MKLRISFLVTLLSVFVSITATAQFKKIYAPKSFTLTGLEGNTPKTAPAQKWFLPGLKSDRDRVAYKSTVPALNMPASLPASDMYWIGSVTSQSYNQGKIGRYYYWDIQGNLRESYLFLDIAGKNKRGLKLVFPRHHAFF